MFESLSEHERAIVLKMIREARGTGRSKTLESLWELDYVRRPPTIKEFLSDPYYLGRVGESIWPVWIDHLHRVFEPGRNVVELGLSGAIGTGKTSIALICQLYKMASLLCVRDPWAFYGLIPGSPIVIGLFNVTADLAYRVLYANMRSYMKTSPFFNEHLLLQKENRASMSEHIRFKNNWLSVSLGSDSIHALGQNVLSGVLDEMAFKSRSASADRAIELYFATSRRISSRFMEGGSSDGAPSSPGMLTLVSSKKFSTDFIEEHLQKLEGKPGGMVISMAQWEGKPRRWSGKKFRVLVGDKFMKSRILRDEEDVRIVDPGVRVIEVPSEYRSEFDLYLDESIRDIAGIMTFAVGTLIPRRDKVLSAVDRAENKHPFTRDEVHISLDDSESLLQNYLIPDELVVKQKVRRGEPDKYEPKFYPHAKRYLHVDIGLTGDSLGIAMGCRPYIVSVDRIDSNLGVSVQDRAPFVHIDFMLKVSPPAGGEIDLAKIRSFILYLNVLGFSLDVSFDTYQSRDSQQLLAKQGFGKFTGGTVKLMTVSVDRTDDAYLALRTAMYEDRISYYSYAPFIKEVTSVLYDRDKRKVDHPIGGSKDVSDAVAAIVWRMNEDAPDAAVSHGPIDPDVIFGPSHPAGPRREPTDWVLQGYKREDEDDE